MSILKILPTAIDQTANYSFNNVTSNNITVNAVDVYSSVVGANANIALLTAVNVTQNTSISLLQGAMTSANANIVQIFGIALGQNAYSQAAYSTANSAQANTIITQGVDAYQNTRIQAAFDAANNASTTSIDQIARANANAALAQANVATVLAQAAFDYANTVSGGGSGTFTGGLITGNTIFSGSVQANSGVTVANNAGYIQYTLPNYGGTPGQSLITDGYGHLQWTTLTAINGTGGGTSTGFPLVDLGYVWENPTTLFDMGTLA